MQDKVWITRKGEFIRVSDMSTGHIRNCINLIIRKNWRLEYLERLELELLIRSLKK